MTGHGHFHWNELMTKDVEKAKGFYSESIGWTFNDMPMPDGTYTVCMDGETPVGGMFDTTGQAGMENVPATWFAYLSVDDIDARLEKATAAGAKIMRPAFDVPGVGRFAILEQPDGAHIGWMTPAEQG